MKLYNNHTLEELEEIFEICQEESRRRAIQAIAEACTPMRISVEERLPDENKPVVVFINNDIPSLARLIINEDRTYTWGGPDYPDEVTHWMPLPEGPTK